MREALSHMEGNSANYKPLLKMIKRTVILEIAYLALFVSPLTKSLAKGLTNKTLIINHNCIVYITVDPCAVLALGSQPLEENRLTGWSIRVSNIHA